MFNVISNQNQFLLKTNCINFFNKLNIIFIIIKQKDNTLTFIKKKLLVKIILFYLRRIKIDMKLGYHKKINKGSI